MTRVLLAILALVALSGQRDPILVPEVSQHEIRVRQGFTGTELLLYGAILDPQGRRAQQPYDIVVVLKGPTEPSRSRPARTISTALVVSECIIVAAMVTNRIWNSEVPTTTLALMPRI